MTKQMSLVTVPEPAQPAGIDLHNVGIDSLFSQVSNARIVFCDPPWNYSNNGDKTRSAASHYPCLKMADIVSHVRQSYDSAADDSYLVLWATYPLLREWMDAATDATIGWTYVTGGAWAKIGAPGCGFHWRGNAEPILIYRKGRPKPCTSKLLRSVHVTDQHRGRGQKSGEALAHSEKPISYQTNMIEVWSNPGDLIFDIYAGLCSVGRAVIRAGGGRRYIGAEIDPERYRQAVDRLALDKSTRRGQPEPSDNADPGQLMDVLINEARPFVYRQQYYGKHEQDRADAVAWMQKYTDQKHGGGKMSERYASEFDRRTEEKERDRYDDWAAQIEAKIPEGKPGEVPDIHECANCGRSSDDMDELLRRCGDSRGEWYCHRGQGCQSREG